jgi:YD repeat-containing protein
MKKYILTIVLTSIFLNKTNAQNVQYKYDADNRLIEVLYPNKMSVKYTYDKDGNRTQQATLRTGSQTSIDKTDSLNLVSNKLKVYPNPTSSNFKADFNVSDNNDVTITILDLNGKEIYSDTKKYDIGNHTFELDITPLPAGTYFVRVYSISMDKSEKVVVIK